MLEGDPAQGIVDIDTFSYFVIGYTSEVFDSPPNVETDPYKLLQPGFRSFAPQYLPDSFYIDQLNGQVHIPRCPFDGVPQSLRGIMELGYDAASIEETKAVTVTVDRNSYLTFRLESPSVEGVVDTLGEHVTWNGPILYLKDDVRTQKGNFFIAKPSLRQVLETRNWLDRLSQGELPDPNNITFGEPSINKPLTLPASLDQLQDTARFLHKFRDRATIYRPTSKT